MADFQKQVIVGIGADVSGFQQGADEVKKKLELINNTVSDKSIKTLKQELKEASNATQRLFQEMKKAADEAEEIGKSFGKSSSQYNEAIKKVETLKTGYEAGAKAVAKLKNDQDELNLSVKNFNPEGLQALGSLARAGVGAIQGVTGAMAFLGVESDDAAKTLVKLQGLMAFSDALNSLGDLKDTWKNIGSLISSSTLLQKANNITTAAASGIMKAFGISVAATSTSFKVLKTAIAATGIGLLVVALAEILPRITEWISSTSSAAEAQKNLQAAIDGVNRSLEANQRMIEFDAAFTEERLKQAGATEQQIRQNRIKAYKQEYDDLVAQGKRLKEARDSNPDADPEENQKINDKMLELSSKASDKYNQILLAQEQDKTAIIEKGRADAKAAYDKSMAQAKADREKELAAIKKYNEDLEALNEEALKNIAERGMNQRDLELKQNQDSLEAKLRIASEGFDKEQALLEKDFKAGLITQDKYNAAKLKSEKAYNEATLNLVMDSSNKEYDIKKKFHDLITKFIGDQGKSAYDKRKQSIIDEYDALIKVADEKEAEVLATRKATALKDAETEETLRINTVKSQTNLVISETQNVVNDNDSPEQRKNKVAALQTAQLEAENDAFELKKEQLKGQQEEIALLEAEHQKNIVDITKQASDAKKTIDKAEMEAKLANAQAVGQALGSISALVGESTVLGKSLAVAQATIDTYAGASKALAQGGVIGIATGAAVIAAGLLNVKKILSTKIPQVKGMKGDSVTAPNLTASAPVIQASAASTTPQSIQDVRLTNPNDMVVNAYITDKDIKTSQQRRDEYDRLKNG